MTKLSNIENEEIYDSYYHGFYRDIRNEYKKRYGVSVGLPTIYSALENSDVSTPTRFKIFQIAIRLARKRKAELSKLLEEALK